MINPRGSTGYGQAFVDGVNGDWGGKPFTDLMTGLDYAEQHYPFIDKNRECALGASYGGYMANWILGHTNRFKCIVTHDGMFNAESAFGIHRRRLVQRVGIQRQTLGLLRQARRGKPFPQMVPVPLRKELQDPHARHPQPARLPPRRLAKASSSSTPCSCSKSPARCSTSPTKATGCRSPKTPSSGTKPSTPGSTNGSETVQERRNRIIKG